MSKPEVNKRTGLMQDPRIYQIMALSSLVAYGTLALDLEITPARTLVTLMSTVAAQLLCTIIFRLPKFEPRSALISGLSLTLLLRTNSELIVVVAAVVTITSKFVLRWDDRHLFNPTCLGLVIMMALTDSVWVSTGQWGSVALFGLLLACIGMLVVHRAARSDVTAAFLIAYAALLLGRAWWLGDPIAIPLHVMQNGALILFSFFMISDPKTTPNSRTGRILFATIVACGAFFVQYGLYEQNGLLWALAGTALTVPVLDLVFPGTPYQWTDSKPSHPSLKGGRYVTQTVRPRVVPAAAGVRVAGSGVLRLLRR